MSLRLRVITLFRGSLYRILICSHYPGLHVLPYWFWLSYSQAGGIAFSTPDLYSTIARPEPLTTYKLASDRESALSPPILFKLRFDRSLHGLEIGAPVELSSVKIGHVTTAHSVPFFIDVLPVGVPAQLDTSQLVIRQGDSGAVVLDNERWLSPLGEEIRTALSANLVQRLHTQDVSGLMRPTGIPVVRIHLQVRRFDSWPGQSVAFDADWSLSTVGKGDEREQLLCRSQFTERAVGDDSAMLHAQQQIITRLAEHIATTAARWMPDRQGTCLTPPLQP